MLQKSRPPAIATSKQEETIFPTTNNASPSNERTNVRTPSPHEKLPKPVVIRAPALVSNGDNHWIRNRQGRPVTPVYKLHPSSVAEGSDGYESDISDNDTATPFTKGVTNSTTQINSTSTSLSSDDNVTITSPMLILTSKPKNTGATARVAPAPESFSAPTAAVTAMVTSTQAKTPPSMPASPLPQHGCFAWCFKKN